LGIDTYIIFYIYGNIDIDHSLNVLIYYITLQLCIEDFGQRHSK